MSIQYDCELADKAVQFLSQTPYFSNRVRSIRSSTRKAEINPFKGEVAFLNELVRIGRQSEQEMENLIARAKSNRGGERTELRLSYQRQFMRNKRFRETLFLEITQIQESKTLDAQARRSCLIVQRAIWELGKENYVKKRFSEESSYCMTSNFELKGKLIRQYWESVQTRLIDQLSRLDPQVAQKVITRHLAK